MLKSSGDDESSLQPAWRLGMEFIYLFILNINFSLFQFSLKTAFWGMVQPLSSGHMAGSTLSMPTYFNLYLSSIPGTSRVLHTLIPCTLFIQPSLHSPMWIQLSFLTNLIFKVLKLRWAPQNYQISPQDIFLMQTILPLWQLQRQTNWPLLFTKITFTIYNLQVFSLSRKY